MDTPRFEARQDGEEWGVWDTQVGAFVTFGRHEPGGAISRWPQPAAVRAAERMNSGTPENRRRWTRHGLP